MSLRSLELHFTFPKMQEISKYQQYMQQKTMIEQSLFLTEIKQLDQEKRKKIEKTSKTELNGNHSTRTPKNIDPNKGRMIDIEL